MKKSIAILILFFTVSVVAQKHEATLFFKDGTVVKGLAKIVQKGFALKIKFRKKKGEKKTFYAFEELETIEIKRKKNRGIITHTYCHKRTAEHGYTLLEQIEKGTVNLYAFWEEIEPFSRGAIINMSMLPSSYSISSYYVAKENKETAIQLGSKANLFGKNFKKAASKYFKDCPELTAKIQSREYKKKHIVKIVKYYNENCD